MSEQPTDYKINCNLCGKIHIPIWGKSSVETVYEVTPRDIKVPYTCPVTGQKAEVTFPFSFEIDGKSITGWKED
jgi:hypothetical protein